METVQFDYGKFMQNFFKASDETEEPKSFALSFAKYCKDSIFRGAFPIGLSTGVYISPALKQLKNVSMLNANSSMEFITKRILLISETSILTHTEGNQRQFDFFFSQGRGSGWSDDELTYYLKCSDLESVGKWLRDCKPLLVNGKIFYMPNIIVNQIREIDYPGIFSQTEYIHQPLQNYVLDVVQDNKKLVQEGTNREYETFRFQPKAISKFLYPIMETEIPFIDNIGLETFSKISIDETEALDSFRSYLRAKYIDLSGTEGSEQQEREITKISFEIQDGLKKLQSDFKKLSRKTAFQATGATIALTGTILVAVNANMFSQIPELLGVSGGVFGVAKILNDYFREKNDLKESPYYYLWIFKNKKSG